MFIRGYIIINCLTTIVSNPSKALSNHTRRSNIMMEFTGITATFQGLKSAYESVKDLLQQRDDREAQRLLEPLLSKILEAQEVTLSLHTSHIMLYNEKLELEKRQKEIERFEPHKQDYRLIQVQNGGGVYAFQPTSHSVKDAHWLCPSCFEASKSSILQPTTGFIKGGKTWKCSSCDHQLFTSSYPKLPPPT